jgi:hypothetical protein
MVSLWTPIPSVSWVTGTADQVTRGPQRVRGSDGNSLIASFIQWVARVASSSGWFATIIMSNHRALVAVALSLGSSTTSG